MHVKPAYFDPDTVALLGETLDDAWDCFRPQERATTSRTIQIACLTRQ